MQKISTYIYDVLGYNTQPQPIAKSRLGQLPLFITETYNFYDYSLLDRELILAELKDEENFSVLQIEKQFAQLKQTLGKKIVLIGDNVTSFNRKRLIEKGINFIVPGKQLFLPDLLIDLRENYSNPKVRVKDQKLLPSAQLILLYHILHRYDDIKTERKPSYREKDLPVYKIGEYPLYKLADKFGYTKMAISNAVDDLKYHELCNVTGNKEKFIEFRFDRSELWHRAQKLLINPVIKRVFVDEKPPGFSYHSNAWALPEYSEINRSRQEYYAIEKGRFYELQKGGQLKNLNDQEGKICLEVWKYDPDILATGITEESNVDPLSLYLSFKDSHDERIEMALEKIIDKFIW
jgi:phosphoribosylformylglycinamidine (FGAM) synthase PurS component